MFTKYEDAETFVLEVNEKYPNLLDTHCWSLESFSDTLVNMPQTATYNEFVMKHLAGSSDNPEEAYNNADSLHWSETQFLQKLIAEYQNIQKKIERSDNWLNSSASNFSDGREWEAGFRAALARFIVKEGQNASLTLSYYGWKEYEKVSDAPVVAVFHLIEETVGEFTGTFTDSESSTCVTAEVLYADGITGYKRWVGSLSEAVRKMLN